MIVVRLEKLHNRCVMDEQYSCHRREAVPVRHGTDLSLLEASRIKVSQEQEKRRSRFGHQPPVHTGPVEKDQPAQDKEYARHSAMYDTPGKEVINNKVGLFTGVEPDAPIESLFDQPLSATPTSTTFGADVHSRPQSPNMSQGKGSHSRSQFVPSRKVLFQPRERATSATSIPEEYEELRNIGSRVTHSVETSPSSFTTPIFEQFHSSYPAPTSLNYEDPKSQNEESDPSKSRELVSNEGSLNSTIKGGDDNEIAPANSDVQVHENGQNIQDTQSRNDGIAEDASTHNDDVPIPPSIPRFEGNQGEQNGHQYHKMNEEEETQPLEDPLELSETPLSRIERIKKFLRTKLCCG
jgi:hypothetical protein